MLTKGRGDEGDLSAGTLSSEAPSYKFWALTGRTRCWQQGPSTNLWTRTREASEEQQDAAFVPGVHTGVGKSAGHPFSVAQAGIGCHDLSWNVSPGPWLGDGTHLGPGGAGHSDLLVPSGLWNRTILKNAIWCHLVEEQFWGPVCKKLRVKSVYRVCLTPGLWTSHHLT